LQTINLIVELAAEKTRKDNERLLHAFGKEHAYEISHAEHANALVHRLANTFKQAITAADLSMCIIPVSDIFDYGENNEDESKQLKNKQIKKGFMGRDWKEFKAQFLCYSTNYPHAHGDFAI
jgi:polynucleotide 5'-kinase involved in rRNA processing